MRVYPYKFVPIYIEKVWGGRALERLFDRALPAGADIGESWELADLAEGESVVANGPEAGKTLNELLRRDGEAILGRARPMPDGRFPLLLKLLDANDILSLQVHPDAAAVERIGPGAALKTECWFVLASSAGTILKGVEPGVTADDFRRALAGGDDAERVRALVRRLDVAAGDFHYLPAGTVHALGAGVVVAEIQTPSDTTYRLSDWGRGRRIDVDLALACAHFAPAPDPPGADGDFLLRTPFFSVRRAVAAPGRTAPTAGRCAAWMVLSGRGNLACDAGAASLSPGDTVLIPAAGRPALTVADEMTYLEITLPET